MFTCYPIKKKIKESFNNFKYKLVIGAMFKNEGHIIKEWVDHYKFHGVDHIYLINDGSTDNSEEILQSYINEGYVTLFNYFPNEEKLRQIELYELYFRNVLKDSEWMSIIDLDEFIYSPKYLNLKDALHKYNDTACLFMDWKMFGSNGHIEQPKWVVQSFTKRKIKKGHNGKSIFKTEFLKSFDIHMANVGDNEIKIIKDIIINHYAIQSWSFFEKVKMTRGDSYFGHNIRDKAYFDSYDHNEIDDNRLALQNEHLFT